jgi:hypothetical protein
MGRKVIALDLMAHDIKGRIIGILLLCIMIGLKLFFIIFEIEEGKNISTDNGVVIDKKPFFTKLNFKKNGISWKFNLFLNKDIRKCEIGEKDELVTVNYIRTVTFSSIFRHSIESKKTLKYIRKKHRD